MLEIRKLEQDLLAQQKQLYYEGWRLVLAFIGGGAAFLAAAVAAAKLFQ